MDFGIAKSPHIELTSAGQLLRHAALHVAGAGARAAGGPGARICFALWLDRLPLLTGKQAFRSENVFPCAGADHPGWSRRPRRDRPALPHEVDVFLAGAPKRRGPLPGRARWRGTRRRCRGAPLTRRGRPTPRFRAGRDAAPAAAGAPVPRARRPRPPARAAWSPLSRGPRSCCRRGVLFVIWPARTGPERGRGHRRPRGPPSRPSRRRR
jgi:hypothetical protein